jgi:platelet-activating factor acetylhydrolase
VLYYRNARIAEYCPPDKNVKQGSQVNLTPGERLAEGPEKPVFPLIMFSHGLGGSRTAYNGVCGEFTSYGFVVCAMEHRDGSGARTLVNIRRPKVSAAAQNERLEHKPGSDKHSFDMVDFFPKDDPNDTSPGHRIDRASQSTDRDAPHRIGRSIYSNGHNLRRTG